MAISEIADKRMNIVIVGHVDHGKSTLVGRLLVDTGTIGREKIAEVRKVCEKLGKPFEYAFLLDALKDERTQGITIDTARIFFRSAVREYIILDAPGHIEFLKNMITGAAKAEAALLLIDAKEGIAENSRRHGLILSMLGIKKVVVLVNKMDLVDYDEEIFNFLESEYSKFLDGLGVRAQSFIPISAKEGANVISSSPRLSWYKGPNVLEALDGLENEVPVTATALRMPVQDVYKFDERRIVAGTVESGVLRKGDSVVFLPSGKTSVVESIEAFGGLPPEAVGPGKATGITLGRQVYVKPGEIMCRVGDKALQLRTGSRFKAKIFWIGKKPLREGRLYKLKLSMSRVNVVVEKVEHVLDSETLERHEDRDVVERNNVAVCVFRTLQPLSYDLFEECEATGRFVLVDTYRIAGGGTIIESIFDSGDEKVAVSEKRGDEFERELNAFVRKWFPHWEAKKFD
jgi:bifunctional enzyme CysN/CysC